VTTTAPAATTVLRLRPDRPQRLEALLLGAGPHLEPVLDVGGAANGDLLVVLPVPAVRLPTLLEAPGGLTAGEAVTVLVPLAEALQRLHLAGVAHGGVRAAAVILDEDGSPAWTAPVSPTLARSAGESRFRERVEEDVAAYRALAAALLAPSGARLPDSAELPGLAEALFRVAQPEPVRLVRPAQAPVVGTPARLLPAVEHAAPEPDPRRAVLDAVRAQLGTVRPRVWAGLGAVVVLLAGALTLLPGGDAAPAAVPSPTSARAVASAPSPSPVAGRSKEAGAAIAALLAARNRCLDAGSESCLRRVDAAGSPVLDADLVAARAGADAVRVDAAGLRVRAAGGTALGTTAGATVLAIRDRNEWRLRDVVAERPPGGGDLRSRASPGSRRPRAAP
jgi:hypothetical protein